jgi:hypothetical protein
MANFSILIETNSYMKGQPSKWYLEIKIFNEACYSLSAIKSQHLDSGVKFRVLFLIQRVSLVPLFSLTYFSFSL